MQFKFSITSVGIFCIVDIVISNLVSEAILDAANLTEGSIGDLFVSAGYPKIGDIPLLNRKIFQGFRVTVQEHPYIVSVRRQYSHYVIGSLLTKTLVITVAHPIFNTSYNETGTIPVTSMAAAYHPSNTVSYELKPANDEMYVQRVNAVSVRTPRYTAIALYTYEGVPLAPLGSEFCVILPFHQVSWLFISILALPCLSVPLYELGIVAGETYSDRGTMLHSVVLVIIHEDFNPYTMAADLALLRLYEEFVYKISIKPIALISPTSTLNDERVFVTGWGRCDFTGRELCLPRSTRFLPGEKMDPILRTISFVVTTPNYYCDGYERHKTRLGSGMLCVGLAREENAVAPCLAVPGAPLVSNARLVGLQSWGFGCGYRNDLPLVYSDIRFYQPWILHNVPILRKLNQNNLTEIFQVMTAFTLSKWLSLTRGNREPLKMTHIPKKIPQRNLDVVLSKLKGNIFDVRDFIYSGEFHESKSAMIDSIRIELENSHKNKTQPVKKVITLLPFLDKHKLESEEYSIAKYDATTENITDSEERYDNLIDINEIDIESDDENNDSDDGK